jgi:hypothetical protein
MFVVVVLYVVVMNVADAMFDALISDEYRYTAYDTSPGETVHDSETDKLVLGDGVRIDKTGGAGGSAPACTSMDGEFEGPELLAMLVATTA